MIEKKKKKLYIASISAYALGEYMSMSADKARRIIDQIRGRSYEEALMILELMPYRGCFPIFRLVYSAAANASHNKGFKETNLVIRKAEVNQGNTVKKLKPRARGRSYPIKRSTCHITIVLEDISIYPKYKNYLMYLKKPGCSNENRNIACYDTYSSGGPWDKK
uniref:Large ribosomal subunit protein uL22c n=1 Tax=Paysonia grandiflora TaxID=376801 RepID=A0A6M8Z9S2_9BRAS|nr:ribosomal protein L22 [Paysonia grandiflora]